MEPRPLFADCMTIEPIAVTEYWRPIGRPMTTRFRATVLFQWQSSRVGCSTGITRMM